MDFLIAYLLVGLLVAVANYFFVADNNWMLGGSWKPFVAWIALWWLVVIAWTLLAVIHYWTKYCEANNR